MANRNKYPDDQSYREWEERKNRYNRKMNSQGLYNDNFNQYNTGNQNEYDNPNDYNRVNYFPDNDENRDYDERDYENNQYGTSGTYGYRSNQGQGQSGYKSDFEKHYYQQKPRSRYGGDERNYGNANQAGFDRDWWDRTRDAVASWFGDDDAERRHKKDKRNMGYRGKGPKNYHRSEQRIWEDICDRLTEDDMVDATDIDVQVQGTEVILTGNVSSREQKRRAEDIVESVSGVHNVENRIRVVQTQTAMNTGTTTT